MKVLCAVVFLYALVPRTKFEKVGNASISCVVFSNYFPVEYNIFFIVIRLLRM